MSKLHAIAKQVSGLTYGEMSEMAAGINKHINASSEGVKTFRLPFTEGKPSQDLDLRLVLSEVLHRWSADLVAEEAAEIERIGESLSPAAPREA